MFSFRPFKVEPTTGILEVQEAMQIDVHFCPETSDEHSKDLVIHYDTGESRSADFVSVSVSIRNLESRRQRNYHFIFLDDFDFYGQTRWKRQILGTPQRNLFLKTVLLCFVESKKLAYNMYKKQIDLEKAASLQFLPWLFLLLLL